MPWNLLEGSHHLRHQQEADLNRTQLLRRPRHLLREPRTDLATTNPDQSKITEEKTEDESDDWNQVYVTTHNGETFQSVARKYGLNTNELLNHNLHGGRPPGPMDRMVRGTEVWLPDNATVAPSDSEPIPPKRVIDTQIVGRVFKRNIPGYGTHYGAVVDGRDQRGRYRVVYDDLDGIYPSRPIYLTREQITRDLLAKGDGLIHVEEALEGAPTR